MHWQLIRNYLHVLHCATIKEEVTWSAAHCGRGVAGPTVGISSGVAAPKTMTDILRVFETIEYLIIIYLMIL